MPNWKPIVLKPLTGRFDAASFPADIAPGAFRWRQNWQITDEGKLTRRDGHEKLFSGLIEPYVNHDHHDQGENYAGGERREPINMLFESTSLAGFRRLFDGTQSRISVLDQDAGTWTNLTTGKGAAGSRWRAAELQDKVVFTNNEDPVQIHALGSGATADIADLKDNVNVTKARIVVKFGGFIVIMNVFQNGQLYSSRVRWCDLNDPDVWSVDENNNLAGYYDLEYGDPILNAEILGGQMLIYTQRSIWSMVYGGATNAQLTDFNSVFAFTRIYTERKTQKGMLVYPNTLVSTGKDHYYMGKDGVYKFNRYLRSPERVDWIHEASAIAFDSNRYSTAIDPEDCELPIGHYNPDREEILFSWSTNAPDGTNNVTLACNIKWMTCDYIDTGYNAFTYFTPKEDCNTRGAMLVASSGFDWCLKEIGNFTFREYADIQDLQKSVAQMNYAELGFKSILRGRVPTGSDTKGILLRNVEVGHESTEDQAYPARIRLRMGQQNVWADPNLVSGKCAVVWRRHPDRPLACSDEYTAEQHEAQGTAPDPSTEWPCYEKARHHYFDFSIEGLGGGNAVYCTSNWTDIKFSVKATELVNPNFT